MLDRRAFLCGSVSLSLVPPVAVQAQQAAKVHLIGYLSGGPRPAVRAEPFQQAFEQGLRDLGWVDGQNIVIERRYAEGKFEQLSELADELVRLKADVIVATSTPAALAAKRATSTIPIVVPVSGDPVATGLVASFARPGGNVTGINLMVADVTAKRVELLKEALPGLSRIGILYNATYTEAARDARHTQELIAVRQLHLSLNEVGVRAPADLDTAFAQLIEQRVEAVVVSPDPLTVGARRRIAELAAAHRLPAIYGLDVFVAAGGLMSYGASLTYVLRRAAVYVDRILRGANPADLPMEQPTKCELFINLKTARALGLTIPPSLLLRADKVIE